MITFIWYFCIVMACLLVGFIVGALSITKRILDTRKFVWGSQTYSVVPDGPRDLHWAEVPGAPKADVALRDNIRRVLHEQMASGQYDSSIERAIQRNNQRKGQASK